MFDKRKEFQVIDEKLNEIRILCNRCQIPFVWVAAVMDDGKHTEYQVCVDPNTQKDSRDKHYICNALTPGTLEVEVTDDKIKDIVKVLNGFRVVASTKDITAEDFDLSQHTGGSTHRIYDKEVGGFFITEDAMENEEETKMSYDDKKVPLDAFEDEIDVKINNCNYDDLTKIDDDFKHHE